MKAVEDLENKETSIDEKVPQDYPLSDYLIIYQEPFPMPSIDRFYNEDKFSNPFFNNYFSPFPFYPMFQDPFGFTPFNSMHSVMMSKLLNSFPNLKNLQSKNPDLDMDFDLQVQSCDSIDSELKNSEDNYQTKNFISYHYETSTCNCNQTSYCKISFSKPDLDFCYLKEILNDEQLNNCELLENCHNDENKCDGIYIDHRLNKFFRVYCEGDRMVPNVSAKSAKQFVLQLKNCF